MTLLVNGAGLAMNTVDALADYGGQCSNFLDTGGKATAETVKASFALILKDSNVKVVFVNIFGGLTRCDMIAEGIILAYQEMEIGVPVVVRLRGTNEGEGQKLVSPAFFILIVAFILSFSSFSHLCIIGGLSWDLQEAMDLL